MTTKKSVRRRFQKNPDLSLPIEAYPTVTLLQRVEAAMAKAGLRNRSDLVCALLDRWATERGV